MLRWHYPLVDEHLTVRRIHSSSSMFEDLVAPRIIPVVQDIAQKVDPCPYVPCDIRLQATLLAIYL